MAQDSAQEFDIEHKSQNAKNEMSAFMQKVLIERTRIAAYLPCPAYDRDPLLLLIFVGAKFAHRKVLFSRRFIF